MQAAGSNHLYYKLKHISSALRTSIAGCDPFKGSLRRKIYNFIIEALYSPSSSEGLIISLHSRFTELFSPYDVDFVNTVDISLCLDTH